MKNARFASFGGDSELNFNNTALKSLSKGLSSFGYLGCIDGDVHLTSCISRLMGLPRIGIATQEKRNNEQNREQRKEKGEFFYWNIFESLI